MKNNVSNIRLSPGILTFAVFFLLTFQSIAAPVHRENAETIARNFFLLQTGQPLDGDALFCETIVNEEHILYYIFQKTGGGFILVSGDDRYVPIIGYSTEGYFQAENQPAHFRSFMENYENQILHLIHSATATDPEMAKRWDDLANITGKENHSQRSVSPLCHSKWNQDYPYNALCPADGTGPGGHVYAGCVATAMSQIMFYWRWPLQGTGQHSYNWPPYGTISADFGTTAYNWDAMGISTSLVNEPMALIQFHCGVGVDMMYGPGGSGAYSEDVPAAIQNYFGYHPQSQALQRWNYSDEQWMQEIRQQIDQGTPLYYSGCSNSGCHAFVCDGYDNNSPALFHFNFGWGGQSDGYYTLENAGGFSSWQQIVIHFKPVDNYTYPTQDFTHVTARTGTLEDGSGPVKPYAHMAGYKWLIDPQTPEDSITDITLKFYCFEMASGDTLFVFDGGDENAPLLGAYTGNNLPASLTSSGNRLLLHMVTDATQNANGWLLDFSSSSPVWCQGSLIMNEEAGELSDGSGSFFYNNYSTCIYQIKPASGQPVTIVFDAFDTEPVNDFLRIYDGITQQLLATYSGSYAPDALPAPVSSENGFLFLVFKTNSSVKGQGWKAHYITGSVGIPEKMDSSPVLFPNPARNMTRIEFRGLNELTANIRLINPQGVCLRHFLQVPASGTSDLDISGLPRGIYLVAVDTGKNRWNLRLIIP